MAKFLLGIACATSYLLLALHASDAPSIGANKIPVSLSCQEDEVIAFDTATPIPHSLACINLETLIGRG